MGRVWAKKNSNWAETHFWKTCSDFLGKENAQKRMPFCHTSTFSIFFSPFSFTLGLLGAAGVFPVFFLLRFWLFASFSHGWEVVFVVLGIGLSSSRFWSCWCIFHSRFWKFHVFLPWLWRAIRVFGYLTDCWSHAQTIWGVFPCCELCSLISFRTVCFPPCCELFLLLRLGLCSSFLLFKL